MRRTPQREGRQWLPVTCPFCEAPAKRPVALEGVLESHGGRCACGALYVADESGTRGGQALVDGLVTLCAGDLDRAMSITPGQDYELAEIPYDPRTFSVVSRQPGRGGNVKPRVFFFRRLGEDARP